MDEAERILAKHWLEWERNGDETLGLRCEFRADRQISLWLTEARRQSAPVAVTTAAVVTAV